MSRETTVASKPSREPSPTGRLADGLRDVGIGVGIVLAVALVVTVGADELAAGSGGEALSWIVQPERAAELIDEQDDPVVLDTRGEAAWNEEHVAGAVPVEWGEFTASSEEDRGELLEETSELQAKLRALGVDADRPVFVVGNPPDNWGEDGRIVWMLRTLGHERAALVDGGHAALAEQGVETTDEATEPEEGNFEVERRESWTIARSEIKGLVGDDSEAVIVDTRSEREFGGETPYGENRPGHLPGAVHLHYRRLLDDEGRLRPSSEIRELLEQRGISPDNRVVAYCTGGVRSAWLTAVLVDLGFERVANYPGSAWDWAAADEEEYPLVVE